MLARIKVTHVNLAVTQATSIARITYTGEVVDPVHTDAMFAQIIRAVIIIVLATFAVEAQGTVTDEAVEGVPAGAPIVAGVGRAVIQVAFTVSAAKPVDTGAPETVNFIGANAVVLARIRRALVSVSFTVLSLIS